MDQKLNFLFQNIEKLNIRNLLKFEFLYLQVIQIWKVLGILGISFET